MTPQEAIDLYDAALADFNTCVRQRLDAWRPMKDIESEIIVNGGHGGIDITTGKNAEMREALLRLARNLHPEWVRLDREVRNADADKETALETMQMCRAVLAYETALANERAAIGGGR